MIAEGLLDSFCRECRTLVDEAGDAPRGGHVDEHGLAFLAQCLEARVAEGLVDRACRHIRARRGAGRGTIELHEQAERAGNGGGCKTPRYETAPGTMLREAVHPRSERYEQRTRERDEHAEVAYLLREHPDEPCC